MSQDLFEAYTGIVIFFTQVTFPSEIIHGDFLLGYFHSVALDEGFMSRNP